MNTNIQKNNGKRQTVSRMRRPNLTIYHPNGRGSGSAIQVELIPADADHDGCIMLGMANQHTIGSVNGDVRTFPTFDWENKITVKLDFSDLCKMLQVFKGECEVIADGKGIYHKTARSSTRIVVRHLVEPIQGYAIELYRSGSEREEDNHNSRIVLNSWEAFGLSMSIEDSIGLICFGVPCTSGGGRRFSGNDSGDEDVSAA